MGGLLTGQLAYVFLVAILDAALISWIALGWYRRSVLRLMRERGAPSRVTGAVESAPDQAPPSTPATPLEPLTFAVFDSDGRAQSRSSQLTDIGRGRLSIVYAIGAALHAAVITYSFFSASTTGHRLPRGSRSGWCSPGPSYRRLRSCSC